MSRSCVWAVIAGLWLSTGACGGSDGPSLHAIIEVPPETSFAYPYEGLQELELAIARAGEEAPLAASRVVVGEPLSLAQVPFGADLVVRLSGRAAGVEIAFGRTCPVEVSADSDRIESRLYFARIVRWGPGADPAVPERVGGLAYRLPDGSAMFLGGGVSTFERFDPISTGTFTQLGTGLAGRTGSLIATFGDVRALVIGGVDDAGDGVPLVELIDPNGGAGRRVDAQIGPALSGHALAALVDGTILVAGGRAQTAPGQPWLVTDGARRYRVAGGGQLDPASMLGETLNIARADHSMTRLGDEVGADVLIVGGRDQGGAPVGAVELYRPLRESFELLGASLAVPRWAHRTVRLPGGFILVVGGLAPDPGGGEPLAVAKLELYDPVQGQFLDAAQLPPGAGVVGMTMTSLPDGRVLLAGGRDASGVAVRSVLIASLDPINGRVDISQTDPLDVPRADHSAVLMCDGTVLLVGGTTDSAAASSLRYNPPSRGRE